MFGEAGKSFLDHGKHGACMSFAAKVCGGLGMQPGSQREEGSIRTGSVTCLFVACLARLVYGLADMTFEMGWSLGGIMAR